MICITGDIHGRISRVMDLAEKHKLGKEDILVLLGDVGVNYFGPEAGDRFKKKMLNDLMIPILCIHGNHEKRPQSISTYMEQNWHGGTVYVEAEYPNLHFAKDGEIYDLEGLYAIAIGGAYSVDKWFRLKLNYNWFPDEQPSENDKRRIEKKLAEANWKVDLVLSHTCPEKYIPTEAFLKGIDQSTVDQSTEQWLGVVEEKLIYKMWFCGHWHINKRIDRMQFLFDEVHRINEQSELRQSNS